MSESSNVDVTNSANIGWRDFEFLPNRPTKSREALKGKRELLLYLMGIAQKSEGAEVWRALFAEIYSSLKEVEPTA
jgi:hypothetical protein